MNVGDFKKWLVENHVSDDTPLWRPSLVEQGGLEYLSGWGGDIENVTLSTEVFGLALPVEKRKRETGVTLW
jgi:hypothetical protein